MAAQQQWVFQRTPTFRKQFDALLPEQKAKAKKLFKQWKENPFSREFGAHKINRLSALSKRTVRSIHIEANLVATFTVSGNVITSLTIGTEKDVYG